MNPNIKKEKWTPEEDRLLVRLVHQHGSAWAEISRGLEVRLTVPLQQPEGLSVLDHPSDSPRTLGG